MACPYNEWMVQGWDKTIRQFSQKVSILTADVLTSKSKTLLLLLLLFSKSIFIDNVIWSFQTYFRFGTWPYCQHCFLFPIRRILNFYPWGQEDAFAFLYKVCSDCLKSSFFVKLSIDNWHHLLWLWLQIYPLYWAIVSFERNILEKRGVNRKYSLNWIFDPLL